MIAFLIEEPNQSRICETWDPEPKAGEVIVRVSRVGICASDYPIC